jgi:hypothetical protein
MGEEHKRQPSVDARLLFGVGALLCLLLTYVDQILTNLLSRVLGNR